MLNALIKNQPDDCLPDPLISINGSTEHRPQPVPAPSSHLPSGPQNQLSTPDGKAAAAVPHQSKLNPKAESGTLSQKIDWGAHSEVSLSAQDGGCAHTPTGGAHNLRLSHTGLQTPASLIKTSFLHGDLAIKHDLFQGIINCHHLQEMVKIQNC